jgi:hypothetical protein
MIAVKNEGDPCDNYRGCHCVITYYLRKEFSEYGNPFFPIAINVFLPLPGPLPEYRNYPTYTESLGWLARYAGLR